MPSEYYLKLHDPDGTPSAQIVGNGDGGYLTLAYTRQVNAMGMLTFSLRADCFAASLVQHKSVIEVWRRNVAMGLDWYKDFTCLMLHNRRVYDEQGHDRVTYYCPGILWRLYARAVAWRAEINQRSRFLGRPAEEIMKVLVEMNAGASATVAQGRERTASPTNASITNAPDLGRGNVIFWNCAHENLLTTLYKLGGEFAGGDYDLRRVGSTGTNYEFEFYPGQLGTDRTATVRFALENGNMALPMYELNRIEERTAAIVGGQFEGTDREIEIVTGDDYAADNDMEWFVDARSEKSVPLMQDKGAEELKGKRVRPDFNFRVLQSPATYYGRHYFLGDKISYQYGNLTGSAKVDAVTIALGEHGEESIEVELRDV